MEYRVEGRRSVGIPRTWLESIEEIEKECYVEEVQPYRKTDYNLIIYIYMLINIIVYVSTAVICNKTY